VRAELSGAGVDAAKLDEKTLQHMLERVSAKEGFLVSVADIKAGRAITVGQRFPIAYSIAPYASVQKSVNTFGCSGESIMRCVKRMPIIPSAGSV
jgi:hypothetical protein